MSSNGHSPTVAIDAHNLGKRYDIGERLRYRTLRESAAHALKRPFRRDGARTSSRDHIWALEDVSFTVHRGDVIGIVGRNGAGKSTLLKVLSRITEPTRGYVDLYGRVGSLLEVGTGFHQELTGRENIFLNGAILGMRRREINRQFDAIVDFAGVNKFIDTPVKHYSSGMYLRLAFAVAAHLEPEILLVDEVLAVGDAEFQKKCLGKMEDVAQTGRTVLFVSHNMAAVNALCPTTIYLEDGRIRQIGPTAEVIQAYLAASLEGRETGDRRPAVADTPVYIRSVTVSEQRQDEEARTGLAFTLHCTAARSLTGFTVEWHLTSLLGEPLAFGSPDHFRRQPLDAPAGDFAIDVTIDDMPLGVGRYYLSFRLGDLRAKRYFDIFDQALPFDVETFDPHGVGRSFRPRKGFGYFNFPDTFTVRPVDGRMAPISTADHAAP